MMWQCADDDVGAAKRTVAACRCTGARWKTTDCHSATVRKRSAATAKHPIIPRCFAIFLPQPRFSSTEKPFDMKNPQSV
jgi:hypothetical protein